MKLHLFVLTAALALPELILAGSALVLLIWGAFRRRGGGLFTLASMAALAGAGVAAAVGPLGRPIIPGTCRWRVSICG